MPRQCCSKSFACSKETVWVTLALSCFFLSLSFCVLPSGVYLSGNTVPVSAVITALLAGAVGKGVVSLPHATGTALLE